MNPYPFIWGAYAIALAGTGGLTLWSYAAMRRAEAQAESARRER
jgi:hypothetical protein